MQLSKHGSLVSGLLEQLRESDLRGIKGKMVVDLSMQVAMLPGQDGGP